MTKELRQAEILSNLSQFIYTPSSGEVDQHVHAYGVVVGQDCDLLRQFEQRDSQPVEDDFGVLVFVARPASDLATMVNGGIRKRIVQNNDERYHLLEAVPAELENYSEGVPALVIDFRRFFTLPAMQLYWQCEQGGTRRRTILRSPYREHLQNRAFSYLGRVPLPFPHNP